MNSLFYVSDFTIGRFVEAGNALEAAGKFSLLHRPAKYLDTESGLMFTPMLVREYSFMFAQFIHRKKRT